MNPQTKQDRRWTRRKEARPAELLSAALDLFVERGFAATRLDEVAARAGVSKGTLYLYFSSKEELFKAVIRSGIVPLIERGERLLDQHRGPAAELLREIVFNWWESVGTTKLAGIPKLMFSECRNFPEIGRFYYEEVISRGHLLVQAVLERGMRSGEFRRMDANYAMRVILAPLVYLLLWRHSFDFCDSKRVDPEQYLDQHLDMIIHGLGSRGHEEQKAGAREQQKSRAGEEQGGRVSEEQRGSVSAEQRGRVSAEQRGRVSAEQRGLVPAKIISIEKRGGKR